MTRPAPELTPPPVEIPARPKEADVLSLVTGSKMHPNRARLLALGWEEATAPGICDRCFRGFHTGHMIVWEGGLPLGYRAECCSGLFPQS